jgi:hypothetical protein
MSRFVRGRGAPAVASKKAEPKKLEEPIENAEAAPEVLVVSDLAPESGHRAGTSRRTVKEIVADYHAEIERRKAARNAPMIMGAPPLVVDIDVATSALQIANRRAESLFLGKATGENGPYTGIIIVNNLLNTALQPDITIGGFDTGVAGTGSIVTVQSHQVNITASQNFDGNVPGDINLTGNVSINGLSTAGASYIEAWGTAASVAATAEVPFGSTGALSGTVTRIGNTFSIPAADWGTYEVTWRVAVLGGGGLGGTFALRLLSGTLGAPDAFNVPTTLLRTEVSVFPGDTNYSVAYGQALINVPPSDPPVPVTFSLINSIGTTATLYTATGQPTSIVIRRIAQ